MRDEEEFLQAIIAEPDDDGPRLVFADWLEERGDPRAEFIRVQCELASRPARDGRRPGWEAREKALLAQHGKAWLGPLAGLVTAWEFRRGFVEQITISATNLLEHVSLIFGCAPLRRLRLEHARGLVADLAALPPLARLAGLDFGPRQAGLSFGPHRVGDDDLRALASSPHLAPLTELRLDDNGVGPDGVRALVGSRSLTRLKVLDLSGNPIGDAGVQLLAAWPHAAGLSLLSIGRVSLGAASVQALLTSRFLPRRVNLDVPVLPAGQRRALEERFGYTHVWIH
jgi:uncharacterized protein (TIGR02996 family)